MVAQLNLYCGEDCWDEGYDHFSQHEESPSFCHCIQAAPHRRLLPDDSSCFSSLAEDQLAWDDHELVSLATKEKTQKMDCKDYLESLRNEPDMESARREGVEWVLSVTAYFGFSTQTSVLAVYFLDRFLSSLQFQMGTPWTTQLAAVACLSLAAKVEETQVPHLLDLQTEDSKFVFEAKTVQRMELLVLSTLNWKMHPVTPVSFIDYIVRRLGMQTRRHWEFFRRCEQLVLHLVRDFRISGYLPSVVAASVMLHAISQIEPFNPQEYQTQLLDVMEMSKEDVKDCLQLIKNSSMVVAGQKRAPLLQPRSPRGVFDASFNPDTSNGSWVSSSSPASSSSVSRPSKPNPTTSTVERPLTNNGREIQMVHSR